VEEIDGDLLHNAAGVFCVESDVSPGLLLKVQGFLEPECM